ncbi:hypothetical protein H310_05630 [Aphanomyces invadans]|uniref:Uncharacterized protein n=1 Tax=Aphanomyces invadans TaxID=157072 RepID=A0A024UC59_9STRA|nr:hypothetical protein H310_05630 [Aphanomyces invadans]ETW03228.1 hypothetical protein H310_05630 [Aphanomyces invadans]|eukprot:XP_008868612.1 hypothetical protein H310_05630 [Aphanomyces invadans]
MCVVVAVGLLVIGIVLLSFGSLNVTFKAQRVQLAQPQLPTPADPAAYAAFLASPSLGYQFQEPQSTSFYVFNVTNIEDVLQGALPALHQVGPYVYTETSEKLSVAVSSGTPATVSYRVRSSFQFDPLRSNGSEADVVTSVNVTYARTLAKLAAAGFSERTLAASFAHTQLSSLESFFRGPFLAQTKQNALGPYLNSMDDAVRKAALPSALSSFRANVASQSLPQHTTHLIAHVRQARVPTMLTSLYDSFLVQYIPATLTAQYESLSRLSVPRVLSNVVNRLTVEVVPTVTRTRKRLLRQDATPAVLSTMLPRVLANIAPPSILRSYMEAARFEAVPSMLNTIKNELVQAAVSQRTSPAAARQQILLQWSLHSLSSSPATWTNVDSLVGGTPTGTARYGFELNSIPTVANSTASRALSVDVAALLFNEKANVEFSLLTYDPADLTRGFGLWKRAVAMDTDAIATLLAGVNNEVATQNDYLTMAQLDGIREYILYWSQSSILQRDRERYWAQQYAKRTANSNAEPDVDLDLGTAGMQAGFSVIAIGGTNLGLSEATIASLWDATVAPSFLSPQGFIQWSMAIAGDGTAKTAIATAFGLTTPQLTQLVGWLGGVVASSTLQRQAVRHWARGGTPPSPFNNLTQLELFNLEPSISSVVEHGFELSYDPNLLWPDALAEALWTSSHPNAFVTASGFSLWKAVTVSPTGLADMTSALNALGMGTISEDHVRQVSSWLQRWVDHALVEQAIHQWWRDPASFPFLPSSAPFVINRPTLSAAATDALWDASSDISIINPTGYRRWMLSSTTHASLLTSWNTQITVACSGLRGGTNSALFSTVLTSSCGAATLADVAAVQAYVQQMSQDPHVSTALLAQWRCGTTELWDVEPYRNGLQTGWELCRNLSTCGLASSNGTVCQVPTAALQVWNTASAASLVNPITYQNVWLPLLAASTSAAITSAQAAVATAFGQAQWLPWMEVVSQWVTTWVSNEVLVRDVLGLWMGSSCGTGTLVGLPQTTVASVADASCEPGIVDSSNETLYINTNSGGRPSAYFLPDYSLTSASDVGTSMTIERTQAVTTCDHGIRTTTSTSRVYSTTTCLMADIDPAMPGLQRGFEMNAPTTTASIELVQNLWTPSKPYSFLNPTALDGYWSKAATAPAKLTALLDMIHVDAPGLSLDDLITINAWLKAWRHNELMSLFVLRGWLAPNNATIETFDLDPRTPTIDTGFELRWEPAMATTSYPTLSQAQYLWHDANEYSFLAPNTDNVNVGFGAWVQAYTGEIPSSERLLDVMPPLGQTSRRHQVANATIVANIQAATGLTAAQIQAIASWLLSWPDHSFLWRDVLSQWSTQTTQFSDSPARWNVASVDTTGGSANLSGFELPVPVPAGVSISMAQARLLWDIYTPYSFLNPKMLVVWCFASASVATGCPHLVDVTGTVTLGSLQSLGATLTAFQSSVYLGKAFAAATQPPGDRARNFLTVVSGLSASSVVAVANWFTRLPTTSTAYQYLMLLRWQQPILPLDPRLVGYEVAYVFNTTTSVGRNVMPASIVDNVVCPPLSTDLARRVWDPSDSLSFINTARLSAWLEPTPTMPGLSACQVDQIRQWLTSWQSHPWLRQLVESKWFTSCSTVLPCANLTESLFDPQRGFEVGLGPSANFSTWQSIAQIVWDRDSPLSFLHPSGWKVWRTLLTGCATSNVTTGQCAAAATAQTSPTALNYLTAAVRGIVRDSKPADVQEAIYTIGYVWLLQLLDSQDFYRYLNQRVGAPPSSAIRGLATQQWINGTVLNSTAVASQADVRTTDAWNATIQAVETVALPTMGGPPELMTFCNRRSSTEPSCSLGTGYVIDDDAASAMLSRFTDQTKVSVHGLTFARGVVVLDVFLAQPFGTLDECVSHAASLGSMFSTPTPTPATNATANSTNTTNSTSMCYQYLTQQSTPLDQFAINIAPLPAVSLAQLRDWQAYLWHIATKLGYDRPSVLPHGSYFTHQSIRSLLWANPATDSVAPTSTLPLPNIEFPVAESLAQRTPLVANVTANQTTTTISLGLSSTKYGCVIAQVASASTGPRSSIEYQDPSCGYTDGSVFPPGAPSSLSFFWSFGRQVLSLSFSTVTTRFGVALRRYVWPTAWLRFNPALYDDLPVTLTSPHLYNLSSPALPFASGLTPDAQTHTSVVDVEPLTGLVLHSRINWQVNVQIGPTTKWFPNVTASFLPVFWFRRERAAAASAFSSYMDLTDAGPFAPEKVAIWEVVWGVLFVGASAVLFRRMHLTRQRSVRLIQPDHVDGYSSANVDALIHATADDGKRQQ